MKEIRFKSDALQRIVSGVNQLAQTVGSTLGPGGRNVIFRKNIGFPLITKDGVTVAKEVELEDKFENTGALLVRQIAEKTCQDAGDGTTTATILADALLTDGLQCIISGVNPIDIYRHLTSMTNAVVDYISSEIREDISSVPQMREVATVSANWDEEIGGLIAEAFDKVGVNGTIHVEASKSSSNTSLRVIEGINFSRGFVTPYLINNPEKETIEFENPYILLYKGEFQSIQDILGFLQSFKKQISDNPNAGLVIIADGYGPDVIRMFAMNRRNLNLSAIRSPYEKEMRDDTMKDLAMFFGCEVFDPEDRDDFGGRRQLDTLTLSELGRCDKVVVSALTSVFVGGVASKEQIDERIEALKDALNDPNISENRIRQTNVRISQLCARVGIIDVGAHTETEEREKRDRIDDALLATRAALEEGIVPGGGYAYIRALGNKEIFKDAFETEAERIAASILSKALKAPFKKLLSNCGRSDDADMLIYQIVNSKEKNIGYNIKTHELCDLRKVGVVDPFKVTRSALQNAVSVVGLILSSEAIIVE